MNMLGIKKLRHVRTFIYNLKTKSRITSNKIRARCGLYTGYSPLPSYAVFEPTMRCNLNCSFCYQQLKSKTKDEELNPDKLLKLIENISPPVKNLRLIGGEVFVYGFVWELLDILREKKINFTITTNGTLLRGKVLEKLVDYKENILGVGVSIDGLEDKHDKIRGKGTFKMVLNNLVDAGKIFPITVNMVLTNENWHDMSFLLCLLIERVKTLQLFSFSFMQYSTPEEIEDSVKILGWKFKYDQFILRNPEKWASYETIKMIWKLLRMIGRRCSVGIRFEPPITETHLKEFLDDNLDNIMLWCNSIEYPRINYKGKLNLCPIIRDDLSDLVKQSLEEIWNDKKIVSLRQKIINSARLIPLCKRCCKLI